MTKEFPLRQRKCSTLNDLIKRIDETGSADRKMSAGRSRLVDRANDCRSLLQAVEDTLSTALTNVFGATRTLSYLRVLL